MEGSFSLRIQGLEKKYQGFRLGPVNLELKAGRSYGLLGPNGAGKTTLLNCIALQSRLSGGSMQCGERTVVWGDLWWKQQISFVPETPFLYGELTVAGMIGFASHVCPNWDSEFAAEWVRRMALDGSKRVSALSKGTKVKLSVLLGLAQRARLILLDEPTAGLDPDARRDLHELLGQILATKPTCLLISSHLFEDMRSAADEIIILRNGQILLHLPLQELHTLRLHVTERPVAISDPAIIGAWSRNGRQYLVIRGEVPVSPALSRLLAESGPAREVGIEEIYFAVRG
ncbi:MAG: ABC transporter ATP-binding protein [Acidobacteriales bacterium]|nr:ABC transporter ATP-binding protein [Terriglobales bacterium]